MLLVIPCTFWLWLASLSCILGRLLGPRKKQKGDMEWLGAQTGAEVLVRGSCFIQCLFAVAGLDLMSNEREVRETGK